MEESLRLVLILFFFTVAEYIWVRVGFPSRGRKIWGISQIFIIVFVFNTLLSSLIVTLVYFLSTILFVNYLLFNQKVQIYKLALFVVFCILLYFSLRYYFREAVLLNSLVFVGLSFLFFKCVNLLFQTRIEGASISRGEAFLYILDPFTIIMGPISNIRTFVSPKGSLDQKVFRQSISRILLGLLKLFVCAPQFNFISLDAALASDIQGVSPILFLLLCWGSYLSLYFNFSGWIDIVISLSRLRGRALDENFNCPLLSKSVQDFWNRWHITLTELLRKIVFTPTLLFLSRIRKTGGWYMFSAIAAITVTMIFIGIWHGPRSQHLAFALWHAIGISSSLVIRAHPLLSNGIAKIPLALRVFIVQNYIAVSMCWLFGHGLTVDWMPA